MLALLGIAALPYGCDTPDYPPICDTMCSSAAALYTHCLADWGIDWPAAGYTNEERFIEACQTWAWEQAHFETDALERGLLDESGWLEDTCAERETAFSAADATCSTYTEIDWNDVPWSTADPEG